MGYVFNFHLTIGPNLDSRVSLNTSTLQAAPLSKKPRAARKDGPRLGMRERTWSPMDEAMTLTIPYSNLANVCPNPILHNCQGNTWEFQLDKTGNGMLYTD